MTIQCPIRKALSDASENKQSGETFNTEFTSYHLIPREKVYILLHAVLTAELQDANRVPDILSPHRTSNIIMGLIKKSHVLIDPQKYQDAMIAFNDNDNIKLHEAAFLLLQSMTPQPTA